MGSNPLISVIIPHWNRAEFLPACLGSLQEQSYTQHEVILVDNGSTDGSVDLLRGSYPWVRVIEMGLNRGYAYAVNRGIEAARGELVALFNNDARADQRWLEQLRAELAAHPEAGMATPKLLFEDRRTVINAAGDFYSIAGVPGNRGVGEEDRGQFDRLEYVFGPGGAASLLRRSMLEALAETDAQGRRQYLDEDFVSYCEDVDLAWRAQLGGYKCLYVPSAIAYHRLSATGGGATASYYNGRNFLYVIVKDYPGALLKKYWPRIVRAQLGITWEALRAWRGEAARARLRGQWMGLVSLRRMLAKRGRVQRSRRIDDSELEAILSP